MPPPEWTALSSQADRGRMRRVGLLDWLLVLSDRNRVVIGRSLQVVHPFPTHLHRRSWWRILRRVLDAFCNRLSDLLPGQNGLPVLTSDGCLENKAMPRNTGQ